MKLYNKIWLYTLTLLGITSCAVNDPFSDNVQIGQILPTVTWDLGSSVSKAGSEVSFVGKYYISPEGGQIDRSEVWAMIVRTQSSSATCKLTSSLAYTKTVALVDTVRSSQMVASYPHSDQYWNGHEFVLSATFPTSVTLSPQTWVGPKKWGEEEEKVFAMYYPETFKAEFVETVINYLTKDSTYYSDMRHIYVNYDFKVEQFETLNAKYKLDFPTETETANKSDLWFTNTAKVVSYYYTTIDSNGKTMIHEIATKEEAPDGVSVYDVYDSSKWVFCRYSDDTGGPITQIRKEWMPYLKELLSYIAFHEWIYAEQTYTVSFSRKYKLYPEFKVYGTNGKVGTDTTIGKEVELN